MTLAVGTRAQVEARLRGMVDRAGGTKAEARNRAGG